MFIIAKWQDVGLCYHVSKLVNSQGVGVLSLGRLQVVLINEAHVSLPCHPPLPLIHLGNETHSTATLFM